MHKIIIKHPIDRAEGGLLLGNGDLSVSCYQKPGKIVFQLGKNDFWDTRLHMVGNPRPAHIKELRALVQSPGFRVDGLTGAVQSQTLTDRQRELCQSVPAQRYSAPVPKPGPCFYLHYPADWPELQWTQTLELSTGMLRICGKNRDGASLKLEAVVHPRSNRLAIHWDLSGWRAETRYGGNLYGLPELTPVYGTLFKEAEQPEETLRAGLYREHGNRFFDGAILLPPPEITLKNGVLRQDIPGGMTLFSTAMQDGGRCEEYAAILRLLPQKTQCNGNFFVALSTGSAADAQQLAAAGKWPEDPAAAEEAAVEFWSHSQVDFADLTLNRCWYAAMHAKRCVLRRGTVPPGLFVPSTLTDFSLWHGDYHFNYNYQSIFLGDYETNQFETGDAYFDGIAYLMRLGEKISRDYYGIDGGCFIQLCGYPFDVPDDYFGSLPLGRMVYMTGWVAAYFHRRWRWSMDDHFLAEIAWPALKKFAVFYERFLQKREDGRYHAFPSNQGESEFSLAGATDQPQVLQHAAFALHCAAEAAEALHCDLEAAKQWRTIADLLPPSAQAVPKNLAPEFAAFDGQVPAAMGKPDFLTPGTWFHDWYFGQVPYKLTILLRSGRWNPTAYHEELLTMIRRWLQPNGLARAMSIVTHGFNGIWTESMGFAGTLTDLLLTSDSGRIRLFPGLPANHPASFRSLRADGAFLVSARKNATGVERVEIVSEHGETCRIRNPWPGSVCVVTHGRKREVLQGDVIEFSTVAQSRYVLIRANDSPPA